MTEYPLIKHIACEAEFFIKLKSSETEQSSGKCSHFRWQCAYKFLNFYISKAGNGVSIP